MVWRRIQQKEKNVSTIPQFDYTELIINGFKKAFPSFIASDPQEIAKWLYETTSAFSGRYGASNAGGASDDIRCLIAAAAGIELEVCAAREIKNKLRTKLCKAWLTNDHVMIYNVSCGFERNASCATVDLLQVNWLDPYRIEEDEELKNEIPEIIEEWIETLCEPTVHRSVIGNRTRKKLQYKPANRTIKSLFEGSL